MSVVRAIGDRAFQLRSWTPVPIVVGAFALLWSRGGALGPGGPELDRALDIAGLAVALLGQALRVWTLGVVRDGSSGQDRRLIAERLNRRGPYALVRNPLYVGNLGIVLGLLLVANHPVAYVLGLGFFFGSYYFVIRAEEAFLRDKFGEEYDAFCREVRRWVPGLPKASLLYNPWDAWRAIKKEVNPFSAWALGMLVVHGGERWLGGRLEAGEPLRYGVAAGAVLLALGVVKALKVAERRRASK